MAVTNGDDGGHDTDNWGPGVMAGLSMAQLNNLLGTYIKTVREMEGTVGCGSVSLSSSGTILEFKSLYKSDFQPVHIFLPHFYLTINFKSFR